MSFTFTFSWVCDLLYLLFWLLYWILNVLALSRTVSTSVWRAAVKTWLWICVYDSKTGRFCETPVFLIAGVRRRGQYHIFPSSQNSLSGSVPSEFSRKLFQLFIAQNNHGPNKKAEAYRLCITTGTRTGDLKFSCSWNKNEPAVIFCVSCITTLLSLPT